MPELPEVETIVRGLRPLLRKRRIVQIRAGKKSLRRKWAPAWQRQLLGTTISDVCRRGKWIILELNGGRCLLIHLGMTGQLRVMPRQAPVESHTHLVFQLRPGMKELRFRDVRRFGSAEVLSVEALESRFQGMRLGPEPFELTTQQFYDDLRRTRRCLKAVLLDQRVVAGVGNIYADESLFESRLSPRKIGHRVRRPEADRLRRAIVKVLSRAVEKKGSSIRDYLDGNGEGGSYQREFRVYQQTGNPCSRCKTAICQIRLAGRSTHFCPICQR